MPFVRLKTNVGKDKASPADVNAALSKAVATALSRPEEVIMAHTEFGADLLFAASIEPCAFVQLKSIDRVDEASNAKTAAALTAVVSEMLGVPSTRVSIIIDDIRNANWALDGKLLTWVTD